MTLGRASDYGKPNNQSRRLGHVGKGSNTETPLTSSDAYSLDQTLAKRVYHPCVSTCWSSGFSNAESRHTNDKGELATGPPGPTDSESAQLGLCQHVGARVLGRPSDHVECNHTKECQHQWGPPWTGDVDSPTPELDSREASLDDRLPVMMSNGIDRGPVPGLDVCSVTGAADR